MVVADYGSPALRRVFRSHASRASWVRGQIDAKRRTGGFPRAIARGGKGYPKPISLGHLLSRTRGDAGWRGRHTRTSLRRPSYEPAGVWESRSVSRTDPIETRASLLSRSSPSQKTLLSRGLSGTRAASHPPPRRGGRYAAPKVPSIEGKPELGGYALGKPNATPRPPVRTEILSDGRSRMVWSFLHRLFPACE